MENTMYKITLYDMNCSPIFSGVTFWFVEDLEEFERNWLPLQCKLDVPTIERYYRSKLGEIITDYYSDDPELNIVQKVQAEVIAEKKYDFTDKEVILHNTYDWTSKIVFDKLKIKLRILKCNEEYYLVGQYAGKGCVREEPDWNRWYEKDIKYHQMHFFGNPVANYKKRYINWEDLGSPDAYKDFFTNDKEFYKDETIETFVWIPIKQVTADYNLESVEDEELVILMRDIVGEAG